MSIAAPFDDAFTDAFQTTDPATHPADVTWRLLPDHIRAADTSTTLRMFLAGVEDALRPETQHLAAASAGRPVNPATCPDQWLPWLARLLGTDITGLTPAQARSYLARRGRTAVGSDLGLSAAIEATLGGTRYARIDHPGLWQISVTIATDDIVDLPITQAVAARHCPAGATITVTPAEPVTLAAIDATYASLAAITATGKTLDQLRFG